MPGHLSEKIELSQLPVHIAVIMDGNGRWASQRGLPRTAGHKKGANVFGETSRYCRDIGVKYLTVYAFSTENWKRPKQEVDALMGMLREYLKDTVKYKDENIRLCFLGDRTPLSEELCQLMEKAEQGSVQNTGLTVNIALNYGGRDEILRAAKMLAEQCESGSLCASDITEDLFSSALYTAGQPDPDLIVRPSGEHRLSNFLLWQCAYAEFVFMDVLWPDFTSKDLEKAISQYVHRDRRFGGI